MQPIGHPIQVVTAASQACGNVAGATARRRPAGSPATATIKATRLAGRRHSIAPRSFDLRSDFGVLAPLERPDIGGDRPAIGGLNTVGEGIHCAMAVCYYVVEMLDGRLPQTIRMIGRWRRKSALDNHAIAVPQLGMTGSAIDTKALLATGE